MKKKPVKDLKVYRKVSFPAPLFRKFNKVSKELDYTRPGEKWNLLDRLLNDALTFSVEYRNPRASLEDPPF